MTAEQKRIIGLLRRSPVLEAAPNELLLQLLPATTVSDFGARRVIYLPGDRAVGVHFVSSGRVKISKVTRDGKELTLAYRGPGELFGETCLLEGGPREEMAEAMDASSTIEVGREALDRLLASSSLIAYRFARALMSSQRQLETRLEQLIFKDVGAKLAELLLELARQHGVADRRGLLVGIRITHQEMANLIGATRETVSVTLAQFKKKGLIQTEGRKVILSNAEGLRALA